MKVELWSPLCYLPRPDGALTRGAEPGCGASRIGRLGRPGRLRDLGIVALTAWIFRRNHGFAVGWAKGLGGKWNGNDQPTAQGLLVDTERGRWVCLLFFPLLLSTPDSTGMLTEKRLEESQRLVSSRFPNSPV